jgi:carbon-monoxide dehydrogenase medium subunit
MRLEIPTTVAQALASLSEPGARCIAGGQSLGAMMNADLVDPKVLVSLRCIDELRTIETNPGGTVRIGAMTTYSTIAGMIATSGSMALIVQAIPLIAHPQIRNQGTVGGSICHADPAGDLPTLVTCIDATLRIAHVGGQREVLARDFFRGYFETAVRPGELLLSIDVPPAPVGVHAYYEKFMLTHGDFAAASVAVLIGWDSRVCYFARAAVGACGPAPVWRVEVNDLLVGSTLDDETLHHAGTLLRAACDPPDDFRGSRDFRMKLIPRLLRRAVLKAKACAEQSSA